MQASKQSNASNTITIVVNVFKIVAFQCNEILNMQYQKNKFVTVCRVLLYEQQQYKNLNDSESRRYNLKATCIPHMFKST